MGVPPNMPETRLAENGGAPPEQSMTIDRAHTSPPRRRAALAVLTLLAAATAACEAQTDVRGNLPDPKALAEIKPGVNTRADVTRLLGAPSTVATFDKETWYYIGGRVKTVAFFKPEILNRQVLTVKFDKAGKVTDVEKIDATKDRHIPLVARETPTRGKELTFLQQLIANIGRFGGRGGEKSGEP